MIKWKDKNKTVKKIEKEAVYIFKLLYVRNMSCNIIVQTVGRFYSWTINHSVFYNYSLTASQHLFKNNINVK